VLKGATHGAHPDPVPKRTKGLFRRGRRLAIRKDEGQQALTAKSEGEVRMRPRVSAAAKDGRLFGRFEPTEEGFVTLYKAPVLTQVEWVKSGVGARDSRIAYRIWAAARRETTVSLPVGWDAAPAGRASIGSGTEWLRSGISAMLLILSAIVPEEVCVLVNPSHPDSAGMSAAKPSAGSTIPGYPAPPPRQRLAESVPAAQRYSEAVNRERIPVAWVKPSCNQATCLS